MFTILDFLLPFDKGQNIVSNLIRKYTSLGRDVDTNHAYFFLSGNWTDLKFSMSVLYAEPYPRR